MITKELTDVNEKKATDIGWQIILHNDDVNSFEHVISCLMKYCEHDEIQAEQCAHIVHNNGKADVKRGTLDNLIPIRTALLDQRLSATLEKV